MAHKCGESAGVVMLYGLLFTLECSHVPRIFLPFFTLALSFCGYPSGLGLSAFFRTHT